MSLTNPWMQWSTVSKHKKLTNNNLDTTRDREGQSIKFAESLEKFRSQLCRIQLKVNNFICSKENLHEHRRVKKISINSCKYLQSQSTVAEAYENVFLFLHFLFSEAFGVLSGKKSKSETFFVCYSLKIRTS